MGDTSSNSGYNTVDYGMNQPLCCPMLNQPVWNAHPRVYLAVDEYNRATCPYCGTQYKVTQHD